MKFDFVWTFDQATLDAKSSSSVAWSMINTPFKWSSSCWNARAVSPKRIWVCDSPFESNAFTVTVASRRSVTKTSGGKTKHCSRHQSISLSELRSKISGLMKTSWVFAAMEESRTMMRASTPTWLAARPTAPSALAVIFRASKNSRTFIFLKAGSGTGLADTRSIGSGYLAMGITCGAPDCSQAMASERESVLATLCQTILLLWKEMLKTNKGVMIEKIVTSLLEHSVLKEALMLHQKPQKHIEALSWWPIHWTHKGTFCMSRMSRNLQTAIFAALLDMLNVMSLYFCFSGCDMLLLWTNKSIQVKALFLRVSCIAHPTSAFEILNNPPLLYSKPSTLSSKGKGSRGTHLSIASERAPCIKMPQK